MRRFSIIEEKVTPHCIGAMGCSNKMGISLIYHCTKNIRAKFSFMLTRQLHGAVFSSSHLGPLPARPSHSNYVILCANSGVK